LEPEEIQAYKTGNPAMFETIQEEIENYFKQKFIALGKKIGKIELIQVDEDIAVGIIESADDVKPGSTVIISKLSALHILYMIPQKKQDKMRCQRVFTNITG
jgi:hypothetical protein